MTTTITTKLDLQDIKRLQRLIRNPRPLLKVAGEVLVSESQDSFKKQQLGDIKWKLRYPNQSSPFLNVAGALSDLNKGGNIKARRFERGPALKDTGNLSRSVSAHAISNNIVEVGTVISYAKLHQSGGVSKQKVTDTAREKLAKLLKTKRKKIKRERKKGGVKGATAGARAKEELTALQRLGFLFRQSELKTKIVQRPFLGVTDRARKDIREVIENKFKVKSEEA